MSIPSIPTSILQERQIEDASLIGLDRSQEGQAKRVKGERGRNKALEGMQRGRIFFSLLAAVTRLLTPSISEKSASPIFKGSFVFSCGGLI